MKTFKLGLPLKKAMICKNIQGEYYRKDNVATHVPKHGDVAIFRVKEIGKHTRFQVTDGNNAFILPDDYIMAAFGNRYASDQFEGYIPKKPLKEYHILGQGGAIGEVASMHQKLELVGPTTLKLVGYVCDKEGNVLNTAVTPDETLSKEPALNNTKVVLSLGSSMDSGKTTTAGYLTHGLAKGRRNVAYVKLTGTVYTKDKRFVKDCGAFNVLDFSDFGHPSTYLLEEPVLLQLYYALLNQTLEQKPDIIVVEIADGLFQRETSMLLANQVFKKTVDSVMFSSTDSINALKGVEILHDLRYKVLGVSGVITTSPLQLKEAGCKLSVPVLTSEDLMDKKICDRLTL